MLVEMLIKDIWRVFILRSNDFEFLIALFYSGFIEVIWREYALQGYDSIKSVPPVFIDCYSIGCSIADGGGGQF